MMKLVEDAKVQWTKWLDLSQPQKVKGLRLIAIVCFFLFFLLLIIYNVGSNKRATISREDVIVFMEPNPEDLMALRYLLKRSDLFIGGVVLSLTSANLNLAAAEATMRKFLSVVAAEGSERAAVLPVFYGNVQALRNQDFDERVNYSQPTQTVTSCSYKRVWPDASLDYTDTAFATSSFVYSAGTPTSTSTIAFFESWLTSYLTRYGSGLVTAVVLTTTTDIVWYMQRHPEFASVWRQLVISGGVLPSSAVGDTKIVFPLNTVSELNFFFDPNAADAVLNSQTLFNNAPIVWVPLEASRAVVSDASAAAQLLTNPATSFDLGKATTSFAWVASMLSRKRAFESDTTLRLPNDLVACILMGEANLRKVFTMQSGAFRVTTGAGLTLDGGVYAASGKACSVAANSDASTLARHAMQMEAVPYSRESLS